MVKRLKHILWVILKVALTLVGIIVALWLIAYGSLFYLRNHAPESIYSLTESTDGRYHAYIGLRGFMDSHNDYLYVQEKDRPKLKICRVFREDQFSIKWSPNSKRIALVTFDNRRTPTPSVYLYDVSSGLYNDGLNPANRYSILHYDLGIKDRPELPYERWPKIRWKWQSSETIAFTVDYPTGSGKVVSKPAGVFDIVDNGKRLYLKQRAKK